MLKPLPHPFLNRTRAFGGAAIPGVMPPVFMPPQRQFPQPRVISGPTMRPNSASGNSAGYSPYPAASTSIPGPNYAPPSPVPNFVSPPVPNFIGPKMGDDLRGQVGAIGQPVATFSKGGVVKRRYPMRAMRIKRVRAAGGAQAQLKPEGGGDSPDEYGDLSEPNYGEPSTIATGGDQFPLGGTPDPQTISDIFNGPQGQDVNANANVNTSGLPFAGDHSATFGGSPSGPLASPLPFTGGYWANVLGPGSGPNWSGFGEGAPTRLGRFRLSPMARQRFRMAGPNRRFGNRMGADMSVGAPAGQVNFGPLAGQGGFSGAGFRRGGVVRRSIGVPYWGGGLVRQPKGIRPLTPPDTVPAALKPGEVVLNNQQQSAVQPVPGKENLLLPEQLTALNRANGIASAISPPKRPRNQMQAIFASGR